MSKQINEVRQPDPNLVKIAVARQRLLGMAFIASSVGCVAGFIALIAGDTTMTFVIAAVILLTALIVRLATWLSRAS